jgi:hypothetical protein
MLQWGGDFGGIYEDQRHDPEEWVAMARDGLRAGG